LHFLPVKGHAVQLGVGPAEEVERRRLDVAQEVGDPQHGVVVAVLRRLTRLMVHDPDGGPVACGTEPFKIVLKYLLYQCLYFSKNNAKISQFNTAMFFIILNCLKVPRCNIYLHGIKKYLKKSGGTFL
jgi:hypothetical protein